MITLYHGSYIQVGKPLVKLGRKKVDFGQGFYLTKLRLQASSWAKTIAERKDVMPYRHCLYIHLITMR